MGWGADEAICIPNVHSEQGIAQAIQQFDSVDWVIVSHALPYFTPQDIAKKLNWRIISGVRKIHPGKGQTLTIERQFRTQKQAIHIEPPAVIVMRPSAYMTHLPAVMDFSALMNAHVEIWDHIVDDPRPQPERHTLTLPPDEAAFTIVKFIETNRILYDDLPANMTVESTLSAETPLTLADADVIVAGGKGMAYNPKTPPDNAADAFTWRVRDGFDSLLKPIAALLGGTIAASRAVIDGAGIDSSLQVGQTGRWVKPKLYFAAGISGAIQHLQGIRYSDHIIAINTDPEAPIFEIAHLGIVGDVYEILPALLEQLQIDKPQE